MNVYRYALQYSEDSDAWLPVAPAATGESELPPGQFALSILRNVPPGLREVRVIVWDGNHTGEHTALAVEYRSRTAADAADPGGGSAGPQGRDFGRGPQEHRP